jgi:hypothetical protein
VLALALGLPVRAACAQGAADSVRATPADTVRTTPQLKIDAPVKVAPVAAPKAPRLKHDPVPMRRAWMFGLNLGYGATRFVGTWQTLIGEQRTDTPTENPVLVTGHPDWVGTDLESSSTFQYRIGYAISPSLMLGFERAQWFKDFGDYSWRFSTSTLSATWYPGHSHLFVRGGAGFSAMVEKIPQTAPVFIQFSDRGFGIEGAVGYEYDFWKRLSVAPEISLRHMQYGDQVRAQMAVASLGLNWWF